MVVVFDIRIVPLPRRMVNLQELTLLFTTLKKQSFIDGTYMPQLYILFLEIS
jgi:hypothetical protein